MIPLRAGPETSVAATKSYLAALAAIAQLVAAWTAGCGLRSALERSCRTCWTKLGARLVGGAGDCSSALEHLYVVGRGFGLGAAQEAALKCKETCGLHAEAFSTAEVRHGPMALGAARDFPVLLFAQDDATRPGVESAAPSSWRRRGVPVLHRRRRRVPGVDVAADARTLSRDSRRSC